MRQETDPHALTELDAATTPMVVYGAACTWWGMPAEASTTDTGLPCCPDCHGLLFQIDAPTWWEGARQLQTGTIAPPPGMPDELVANYVDYTRWGQGICTGNDQHAKVDWYMRRDELAVHEDDVATDIWAAERRRQQDLAKDYHEQKALAQAAADQPVGHEPRNRAERRAAKRQQRRRGR